jgi:hypothetical protein
MRLKNMHYQPLCDMDTGLCDIPVAMLPQLQESLIEDPYMIQEAVSQHVHGITRMACALQKLSYSVSELLWYSPESGSSIFVSCTGGDCEEVIKLTQTIDQAQNEATMLSRVAETGTAPKLVGFQACSGNFVSEGLHALVRMERVWGTSLFDLVTAATDHDEEWEDIIVSWVGLAAAAYIRQITESRVEQRALRVRNIMCQTAATKGSEGRKRVVLLDYAQARAVDAGEEQAAIDSGRAQLLEDLALYLDEEPVVMGRLAQTLLFD